MTMLAKDMIEGRPMAMAGAGLRTKDLLTIGQLTAGELRGLIELASQVKASPGKHAGALAGKSVTLLFEKPSLRTRLSFEIGLTKLGAHVVYFDHSAQRIGQRESIKDYAKNLERWTDCVVARVFEHSVLTGLAEHGSIPVINALSDLEHPCQALADMQTLAEHFGGLDGLKLAFIGDGNNVCHSLLVAASMLGVSTTVISPKGFEPQFAVVREALDAAEVSGAKIAITNELDEVKGHHAVYTDCWVSMGQSHQSGVRGEAFAGFQVDEEVMDMASAGTGGQSVFMHCLPAHRGEEVVDEVMDAEYALIYDQAENRMHAQNALALRLLK